MKPTSQGQSSYQASSIESNRIVSGTSNFLEVHHGNDNTSGHLFNRSSSQTSRSSVDANDNAARTRRFRVGGGQSCRRQCRSRCRAASRTPGPLKRRRASSCHCLGNQCRREVVRQKQGGRLGTARQHLSSGCRSRIRRNKSRAETFEAEQNSRSATLPVTAKAKSRTRCKNKSGNETIQLLLNTITASLPVVTRAWSHGRSRNKDNARNYQHSSDSCSSSVSRYQLVSLPAQSKEKCPISSYSGTSRRCRPKRNSSNNSSTRGRDHHRHKNRSGNRKAEDSSSGSRNRSNCCQHRERSPLQSPLKSSSCKWQDSTLKFARSSKFSRGHHTKNSSDKRSSDSQSSSDSDVEPVKNEKMQDGDRKAKKHRKHGTFYACVIM